jgi:hypothetical protein
MLLVVRTMTQEDTRRKGHNPLSNPQRRVTMHNLQEVPSSLSISSNTLQCLAHPPNMVLTCYAVTVLSHLSPPPSLSPLEKGPAPVSPCDSGTYPSP